MVDLAEEHEGRGDDPHLGAKDPDIASWIWDGADSHRDEDMQAIEALQVVQLPYAPN